MFLHSKIFYRRHIFQQDQTCMTGLYPAPHSTARQAVIEFRERSSRATISLACEAHRKDLSSFVAAQPEGSSLPDSVAAGIMVRIIPG
jgi:hypothetical protein